MADPDTPQPRIDWRRWFRLSCRSLHLLTTSVLVGGHFYGASAGSLWPWLLGAALTGAGLMATDLLQGVGYLREVRGLVQLVKIVLVASVALVWDLRIFVLFTVVIASGIVSHMPGRYRYWVVGRGPRDEGGEAERAGLG